MNIPHAFLIKRSYCEGRRVISALSYLIGLREASQGDSYYLWLDGGVDMLKAEVCSGLSTSQVSTTSVVTHVYFICGTACNLKRSFSTVLLL